MPVLLTVGSKALGFSWRSSSVIRKCWWVLTRAVQLVVAVVVAATWIASPGAIVDYQMPYIVSLDVGNVVAWGGFPENTTAYGHAVRKVLCMPGHHSVTVIGSRDSKFPREAQAKSILVEVLAEVALPKFGVDVRYHVHNTLTLRSPQDGQEIFVVSVVADLNFLQNSSAPVGGEFALTWREPRIATAEPGDSLTQWKVQINIVETEVGVIRDMPTMHIARDAIQAFIASWLSIEALVQGLRYFFHIW